MASIALHAVILLVALRSPRIERKTSAPSPAPQPSPVRMMYLPPPEAPPQPRPQHLPQPTPAITEAVPRRVAELPSPAKVEAPEHNEPAATSPHPVDQSGGLERSKETTVAEREDAMVSEARRLFGPSPAPRAALAGPVRAGLPVGLMRGGPHCAWSGAEAELIDRPSNAVIEGIVRRESSGQPIPGAFLQMLGTGSATFADETGRYRLRFDPALIDACRSQLVRVTAPGYRARTMILTYGHRSDNVIDLPSRQ